MLMFMSLVAFVTANSVNKKFGVAKPTSWLKHQLACLSSHVERAHDPCTVMEVRMVDEPLHGISLPKWCSIRVFKQDMATCLMQKLSKPYCTFDVVHSFFTPCFELFRSPKEVDVLKLRPVFAFKFGNF